MNRRGFLTGLLAGTALAVTSRLDDIADEYQERKAAKIPARMAGNFKPELWSEAIVAEWKKNFIVGIGGL